MKAKFTAVFLLVLFTTLIFFSTIIYGFISSEYYRPGSSRPRHQMMGRIVQGFPGEDELSPELVDEIQEYFKEQEKERYNQLILTLLVPTLIISGATAYVTAHFLVKPIDELTEEIEQLGDGDFSRRVDSESNTQEVNTLRESFNSMLDKVENAFDSQEEFISDAAHELRTPLASMRANLDLLKDVNTPEQMTEGLAVLNRMSEKLIKLSEDLLYLDRRKVVKTQPIYLNELIDEILEMLNGLVKEKGINLTFKDGFKGKVCVDQKAIARAIENVIENSIKYGAKNIKIELIKKSKHKALLTISDDGVGISEEDLSKIFDRFYRGDSRDEVDGTGLGLAIVKKIIEDHSGEIKIQSVKGKGTDVIITLPM